jgi:hypothetical protein
MKTSFDYWLPRIIGSGSILFISLFALDALSGNQPLTSKILDFAIHLAPSYLLTALLFIAWRWEKIGGFLYLLVGLVCSPFLFVFNFKNNHSVLICLHIVAVICGPLLVTGLLFLRCHFRQQKD